MYVECTTLDYFALVFEVLNRESRIQITTDRSVLPIRFSVSRRAAGTASARPPGAAGRSRGRDERRAMSVPRPVVDATYTGQY